MKNVLIGTQIMTGKEKNRVENMQYNTVLTGARRKCIQQCQTMKSTVPPVMIHHYIPV